MGDVVDENIQAAMFGLDVIEHRLDLFSVGHIGGDKIATDLLGNFLGVRFMARMHDDFSAFTGERPRNSQANIMSRAGNQSDFVSSSMQSSLGNC